MCMIIHLLCLVFFTERYIYMYIYIYKCKYTYTYTHFLVLEGFKWVENDVFFIPPVFVILFVFQHTSWQNVKTWWARIRKSERMWYGRCLAASQLAGLRVPRRFSWKHPEFYVMYFDDHFFLSRSKGPQKSPVIRMIRKDSSYFALLIVKKNAASKLA